MSDEIPERVIERVDAALLKYGNLPIRDGIKMAMSEVVAELVAAERHRARARINHLHSALESIRFNAEPYSTQVAAVALIGQDDWDD